MPDIWLTLGIDYDGDGRVSPFGPPDDALGSSARYLVRRGGYRRGEPWGCEVRLPAGFRASDRSQSYRAWHTAGVERADGAPFARPEASARLWVPEKGGPAFLLEPNFYAVKSYNPSMSYTLALLHLGDRVLGGPFFVQSFPGSERAPTSPRCRRSSAFTALGYAHRRRRRPSRQRNESCRADVPATDRHETRGRLCGRDPARKASSRATAVAKRASTSTSR